MTTPFMLLLATLLPGSAGLENESPFHQALQDESAWVTRAQSPGYSYGTNGSPYFGGGTGQIVNTGTAIPVQQVQQYNGVDPFMNQGGYPAPIQDPFSGGAVQPYMSQIPNGYSMRGINGPQPVRYGWNHRVDFTYIPRESAHPPADGGFEVFGIDAEMIHTKPLGNNWTFLMGPQFSYRSWQGPGEQPGATVDLPGGAYRFGLDMVIRSPTTGGWTFEGGFNPSIATDFRSSLDSNSFLFDAHAVAFWQLGPKWTLAAGVLYWDRVDSIILPYAGAIWTPNDIWELRLIFPKPRISVFLGTPMGVPTWAYVGAEYHVEAYQVKPKTFAEDTQIQLADWRVAGGLRWETGWLTSFAEAGYIFDRKNEYAKYGDKFEVKDGFMARMGFRY